MLTKIFDKDRLNWEKEVSVENRSLKDGISLLEEGWKMGALNSMIGNCSDAVTEGYRYYTIIEHTPTRLTLLLAK